MRFIFVLFIAIPLIEIWLILKVGSLIGVFPTVVLIILTAAIGTYLLRREGVATLFRARQKMDSGALPAQEMAEGIMLAFSGALLLTPGFVTDVVGFSMLSRTIRSALIKRFASKFTIVGAGYSGSATGSAQVESDVIEGEYRRNDQSHENK